MLDPTAVQRLLETLGGLVSIVLPLYHQRRPGRPPIPDDAEAVLQNPHRRELYELIERQPGLTTAKVRETLGLIGGALDNHLVRLQRVGLVEIRRSGGALRIYPAGEAPAENDPVLLPAMTKNVARAVLETPGRTSDELAADVGITRRRVNEHLRLLATIGLVRTVSGQRQLRYEPSDSLEREVNRWRSS